jgi:hypothetical protein
MWVLTMLEGTHALQEEELSFRELAASACSGREDGGEGKCSALDKPFADGRTNGSTITRHGERPNKVPRIVGVNQEEWCTRSPSDHVGDGAQCGGAG